MSSPLGKSILCPILVGRDATLEALDERLAQARGRQGQALLLTGEAGIGKSRLMAEAVARAAAQGFIVLQGNCFEPDRVLPYAPWLDLLRAFWESAEASPTEAAEALRPVAPDLLKLLPELGALLPDVVPSPPREPELEKRRLFETLARFLIGPSAPAGDGPIAPRLIVIEDLHWCDDVSLEFLLTLARRLAGRPILLLLTYRDDEVHPTLRHVLAELDRAHRTVELRLARLTPAEVEGMIRAIFDQPLPVRAEFVEAIHALTDGNPFFIEEVLKSLVTAGEIFYTAGTWTRKPMSELHIPRTVQDAVGRRLEQLSPAARHLATLAAVVGRQFDFALLQHLTGQAEGELLDELKELITAQLMVEASAERFAFRHALSREAIYATLLARERKALHRTIAEALERLDLRAEGGTLADLAYHNDAAEAWEKALDYAWRAGERAQALYAPRSAVEHFTRALGAAGHLDPGRPPTALLRARGQAYDTLGDFEAARADYEAALQLARADDDRPAEWQALLDLGFLWASRDFAQTGRYFERALERARAIGDPASLAQTLNRLGNWHVNIEQPRLGQAYHREALAIFEGLNDRRGLAQTHDLLGGAACLGGDWLPGMSHYAQAAELFRELDDRQGLASCLTWRLHRGPSYLNNTLAVPASAAESLPDGERALRLAREIGWRSGEAFVQVMLALCLGAAGDYARAFELGRGGLELAEEIAHRAWIAAAHIGLGALCLDCLWLPPAQAYLERALELNQAIGLLFGAEVARGLLASTHLLQNERARAEALLVALPAIEARPPTLAQRLGHCAQAELELARGQPRAALRIVRLARNGVGRAPRRVDPPPGDFARSGAHRAASPGRGRGSATGGMGGGARPRHTAVAVAHSSGSGAAASGTGPARDGRRSVRGGSPRRRGTGGRDPRGRRARGVP